MTAYVPEHVWGWNPSTYKNELIPFPEHLKPRPAPETVPSALPTLQFEGGTVFITCKENDRLSLATTIERLIDMLDAMSPDCDLEDAGDDEPYIGWPNGQQPVSAFVSPEMSSDLEIDNSDYEPWLGSVHCHPASFDSPHGRSGFTYHSAAGSQLEWAAGGMDDREDECEDEGAISGDEEYSHGWQNEGDQSRFAHCFGEDVGEGEPDLGFVGHGTGWREKDGHENSEDEHDGCEPELDGGDEEVCGESPMPIPGGGSVSQNEDGWRPAPGPETPRHWVEEAEMLPNDDIVRQMIADREAAKARKPKPDTGDAPLYRPGQFELKASDYYRLPWA